jgi:N-carbamoylputrescine amidase
MRTVKAAAVQMRCTASTEENIQKADSMAREAAARGARIILLQELFETPYFCQRENPKFYHRATELENNAAVRHFRRVAEELEVVLPISFYEKRNNARYNTVAVIDADGGVAGVYRKSHLPGGPGYEEKYYFNPGDTGFRVWDTRYAKIGVGICWDQWFPEAARCMALAGAELLLYPTAIGSEPESPGVDSKAHWQRCMIGHAACNMVPVMAANRVGAEVADGSRIEFYGSSFITDAAGEKIAEAGRTEEAIITAEIDLEQAAYQRAEWGLFRDRRPELYQAILTSDGVTRYHERPR